MLLLAAAGLFVGLGFWQVQRLHWKHALIARVEARVYAEPVALPPALSPGLSYLRVRVAGVYQGRATALVRAATELGTGYWTMTPLWLDDGRILWVNRGFVPAGTARATAAAATPPGRVVVTGLLRADEPGGTLLQANRPDADRWYSRDLATLAAARRIGPVAVMFLDAQVERAGAVATPGPRPVPGLTQVHFPDNHLGYALTWFAMALLSLGALVFVWRSQCRG